MEFFFNDTATTEIYTLSLHDALPIAILNFLDESPERKTSFIEISRGGKLRSEERFSRNAETDLVCRLLLEKKKKKTGVCNQTITKKSSQYSECQHSLYHINPIKLVL